ncbi:hypothetical protein MKEN_00528200 [Mycena kentingensis (nom. inval.)]|nr:hypothetical protein MKEN_00528200 [Mycena kentingensis (nom. inval.)]
MAEPESLYPPPRFLWRRSKRWPSALEAQKLPNAFKWAAENPLPGQATKRRKTDFTLEQYENAFVQRLAKKKEPAAVGVIQQKAYDKIIMRNKHAMVGRAMGRAMLAANSETEATLNDLDATISTRRLVSTSVALPGRGGIDILAVGRLRRCPASDAVARGGVGKSTVAFNSPLLWPLANSHPASTRCSIRLDRGLVVQKAFQQLLFDVDGTTTGTASNRTLFQPSTQVLTAFRCLWDSSLTSMAPSLFQHLRMLPWPAFAET